MSNEVLFRVLTGTKINQYQLVKLLGAGGFGGVFLANEVVRDKVIRQVAIKLIVSDETERQLNELRFSTTLRHPHLLEAYSSGECIIRGEQFIYLVMELADDSLDKKLKQSNLSVVETKQLVIEVAKAILFLNNTPDRLVHRDLKPGNILRVKNVWKVSDLGLIRDMGIESYVNTNNPAGTILYRPPESFDGGIDFSFDIWSLGITIIEVLTGKIPYENFQNLDQLIAKVIKCDLKIPKLPAPFDEIVRGCLQKSNKNRWTAQRILDVLTGKPLNSPNLADNLFNRNNPVFRPPSTLPEFRKEVIAIQNSSVLNLGSNQKLEMVSILSGKLVMASGHEVKLANFRMSKFPITQSQYQAVMDKNPSAFSGRKEPTRPVENIAWVDAVEFCKRLSNQIGKNVRLPSETEWEYACRAGTLTKFCFGDRDHELDQYAWYAHNSGDKTHPVGLKKANKWGLYDMHGNVWEWCGDSWVDDEKELSKMGKCLVNSSEFHAIRGGAWVTTAKGCASSYRGKYMGKSNNIGFRVVCSID